MGAPGQHPDLSCQEVTRQLKALGWMSIVASKASQHNLSPCLPVQFRSPEGTQARQIECVDQSLIGLENDVTGLSSTN